MARIHPGQSELLGQRSQALAGSDEVLSVAYVMRTPAMIGDFTGETFKLLEKDGVLGAAITGVPTAQSLIGKARWLMRVALATVTSAMTHRDAEAVAPLTVHGRGGRKSLGIVEFVFGSSAKRWAGVLSVSVELSTSDSPIRFFDDIGMDEFDAIINARDWFSSPHYYARGKAWRVKDGRYRPRAANRFNSLLAMGALIKKGTFFPVDKAVDKEKRIRLVYPLAPGRVVEGFRLTVRADGKRLRLAGDEERAQKAVRLGVFSLLAVPVLLGLGKAGSRGFGRFTPIADSASGPLSGLVQLIGDGRPGLIVKSLHKLASEAAGSAASADAGWKERAVPVLPVGGLGGLVRSVSSERPRSIEEALDTIGRAAAKIAWKAVDSGTWSMKYLASNVKGGPYHTWPLGLPRGVETENRNEKKIIRTGYWLRANGSLEEGRRQSFLVAYTLDGRVFHIVGFPSGDLVMLHDGVDQDGVRKEIVHIQKFRNKPEEEPPVPVRSLPCKRLSGWGAKVRPVNCSGPEKIIAAFDNFFLVLEKLL